MPIFSSTSAWQQAYDRDSSKLNANDKKAADTTTGSAYQAATADTKAARDTALSNAKAAVGQLSDKNGGAAKDLNALVSKAQFENDVKSNAGLDALKTDANAALDAILPIDKRSGSDFISEAGTAIGAKDSNAGSDFINQGGIKLSAPSRKDPIAAATEYQNENLRGSTQGAPIFNQDASGKPAIRPTDIHQDIAHEGDCQTMAALSSVAKTNPDLIKNNIKQVGTDKSGANLFDVQVYAGGQWTTQRVSDADLPGKGSLQRTDMIWPRLYEAAMIKAYPNRDFLNKNAVDSSQPATGLKMMSSNDALTALTGKPVNVTNTDSGANSLLGAVQAGQTATAGVVGKFGTFMTIDPQTGDTAADDNPNAVTLLRAHQYSVQGVTGSEPNRQVQLFNPYNYPGNGGSTFSVSEATFRKYFGGFDCVTENNAPPAQSGDPAEEPL